MPIEDAETPSERALTAFRERVESDVSLDEAIKRAVLSDLASGSPAQFKSLKETLTTLGKSDEAEES